MLPEHRAGALKAAPFHFGELGVLIQFSAAFFYVAIDFIIDDFIENFNKVPDILG